MLTFNRLFNRAIFFENAGEPTSGKMSEKEFNEFKLRLQRAKVQIYKRYPFFGFVLQRLHTVPTQDVPTMSVDNNNNIYINPNFMMKELSFEETIGVLVHEAFHHVNLTFFRQKGKHGKLWNIATDYIMNRDILEMGAALPSLGLIPTKTIGGEWLIEKIGKLKEIDITNLTSEELYRILEAEVEKNSQTQKSLDRLADKQCELDKHLDPTKDRKPKPMEIPESKDSENADSGENDIYKPNSDTDPKTGKPLTDEEKLAKQKSAISQIAEEVRRHMTSSGSNMIPRSFDVNKLLQPKTNWRALLKDFITKSSSSEYTWLKPAKRALAAGYYAPKMKNLMDTLDIVIAVDTSGSIPAKVVYTFISEVIKIHKMYPKSSIKVLFYNDIVYATLDIKSNKSEQQIKSELGQIKFTVGGNNEPCIKSYLNEQNIKNINGFILFTDGYIHDQPDFPKAKKSLFLIVPGGNDAIVKKYGPVYTIDVE